MVDNVIVRQGPVPRLGPSVQLYQQNRGTRIELDPGKESEVLKHRDSQNFSDTVNKMF